MKKYKIRELNYESFLKERRTEINLKLDVLEGFVGVNDINRLKSVIESIESYENGWCTVNPNCDYRYFASPRGNGKTEFDAQIRANQIVQEYIRKFNGKFEIKRVVLHDPATIVFWQDGTKTVVKCQDGDTYNPETGIAMCFMKKALGNQSNFNNTFKKHIPKAMAEYILSRDHINGIAEKLEKTDTKAKPKANKKYQHLNPEVIHRILRVNKWSIPEFANYVGVHVTTVYAWLRGKGITRRMLSKVVKVLHEPAETLIKED